MEYRSSSTIQSELRAIYADLAGGPLDASDLLPAGSSYNVVASSYPAHCIVWSTQANRVPEQYTSFADYTNL